jgi:hypothetical protein
MLPLETLPLGEPSGGIVYLRTVFSPEQASHLWMFRNSDFYREGLLAPRPTPQSGGPPLVGCPRLLIQFINSYPPYRFPFLYPQPETCSDTEGTWNRLNDEIQISVCTASEWTSWHQKEGQEPFLCCYVVHCCSDTEWYLFVRCFWNPIVDR